MAELFSNDWMVRFMEEWNKEPALATELAYIKFSSTIAYGYINEAKPKGVIIVSKGKVISAGDYQDETLNWDLRAEPEIWKYWFKNPPGMVALGMAYTSKKLKFEHGDYASMIKDPGIAVPFVKSFMVMARV